MRAPIIPTLLLTLPLALAGCAQLGLAPNEPDTEAVRVVKEETEPLHIAVKHVLIGFEGANIPGVSRTLQEAQLLAVDVLEQAGGGEDFDELMLRYSDDRESSGIYAISNFGRNPRAPGEVNRTRLVRGFGDVAFSLKVNEVGLCDYDPKKSPYGFHVIKRIK
jgi:hypothetical protein